MRKLPFHSEILGILTAACLLVVGSGHLVAAEPAVSVPAAEESWQVIYLAGQRVGYARVMVTPVEQDGETWVRTEAETHLSMKRFGQTLTMSNRLESRESLAGDLRGFEFTMKNPPASTTTTVGTVDGNQLKTTTNVNGRKTQTSAAWKSGIKSPTYQDRMLRVQPLKAGETQSFEAFFPEMGKVGTLKVAAGEAEPVPLLDGSRSSLQKLTVSNSLIPGVTTKVWVNTKGDSVKTSTSMLGTEMVTYTVSAEEALKDLSAGELDLGVATLVKTSQIPNPYATRKVVYRVTIPDEDPSKIIPQGDSQTVKKISDHVAEVTVTSLPIPAEGGSAKADPEYLASTQYLQADDEKVREHADQAAGTLTNRAEVARAMETYVQKKLSKKNFSTALASAGEVARNLEGDCTEHAVLLAAMLRAKQVPARVAVGLVYIDPPSAFGGHMWTEAFLDGKWVPVDATLGRGGIGATHLKLGDATFSDDQGTPLAAFTSLITVIGKLQIEVVSVE